MRTLSKMYPSSIDEVVAAVRDSEGNLRIEGAGTKPALMTDLPDDATRLSLAGLAGITEYAPTEFTVTVLAGTPLNTLSAQLSAEGQYLPFDPPWADRGATIGGTIAAGLNGPSRLRHGGARDFMLGVRLVDGRGNLVTGGGKVVKNAAGFDLPKMVVGSRGRLGVLVELTLKVFPQPASYRTVIVQTPSLQSALEHQQRFVNRGLDLAALDLSPSGQMWVRLCGPSAATEQDATQLRSLLDSNSQANVVDSHAEESELWRCRRDDRGSSSQQALIKIPVAPRRIPALDAALSELGATRTYSVAGNVAWVIWPSASSGEPLHRKLLELQLAGLCIDGAMDRVELGHRAAGIFAKQIQQALDPQRRFSGLSY